MLLYGQTFSSLTVEKGLSDNQVHTLEIDGRGLLWVGTDEGLNRYDGYGVTVYRSNPFDDKTISGNRVWTSFKDNKGNVWFGTDNSVDLYRWSNDSFERFSTKSRPTSFFQDKQGYIWVSTIDKGLLKIDTTLNAVTKYLFNALDPTSISNNGFSSFQKTPIVQADSGLWVGSDNGLNYYDDKKNIFKRFYSSEKENSISGNGINTLHIDDEFLWVGTNYGLDRINLENHTVERMAYNGWFSMTGMYAVTQILPFEKNNTMEGGFWMSTYSGLVYYDKNMESWYDVEHELLFGKPINNIIKDTEGNLWIDMNGELVLFNTAAFYYQYGSIAEKDIVLIERDLKNKQSILDVSLNSMASHSQYGTWLGTPRGVSKKVDLVDVFSTLILGYPGIEKLFVDKNNNLWCSSETGLHQFDYSGTTIRKFISDPTDVNTLISNESGPFLIDNQRNVIWVASKFGGLSKVELGFDLRTGKEFVTKQKVERFVYSKEDNNTVLDGGINEMYLDKEGNVFLSFKDGVVIINDDGLQRYEFSDQMGNYHLSDISSFIETGAGEFWVGSKKHGLYRLDKNNMSVVKHYTLDKTNKQSFSSSVVFTLYEDKNKTLWVGTGGDGLYKYNPNSDGFIRYTIADGLPSNTILTLQEDNTGQLWIGTRNGLSRLNVENEAFTNFGATDGMKHRIFKQNCFTKNNGGGIYVGAGDKIVSFYPDNIQKNETPPTLAISYVNTYDTENNKIKKDISERSVTVSSNEIKIEIGIVGISYKKTEKNKFRYKVSNLTSGWVELGSQRKIVLQGLQPDEYAFSFMASNNDNVWSQPSNELKLIVRPPFYKTLWAYSAYLGLAFLTTIGAVRNRDKKQLAKLEEGRRTKELEEAREFQMKMLPKKCPKVMDLEISAGIKTATEVGGDYYDFFPQKDDSVYVVVGDATGHGMTAGMMVSITKAGLYGTPPNIPPNEVSYILNRTIKAIELGKNKMAISIARFWSDRLELTSAAMPPLYHYKSSTKEVDEILLEGLPLGSFKGETYGQLEISSEPGDAFVFISDGLPEATNKSEEMLGYEAVLNCVRENGKNSAGEIKQSLFDLGAAWLDGIQNQDDITVVVVKKADKAT
tara:strand:- start:27483 stop:30794 length:3312 start_codon:yes stop_codon:yes gene_type:complete